MSEINRFSEYSEEKFLTGTKIKFEKLFGKEIIVLGAYFRPSKFNQNPAVKIQLEMDGETYISWSQSAHIIRQAREAADKDKFPFYATPRDQDGSHTFS